MIDRPQLAKASPMAGEVKCAKCSEVYETAAAQCRICKAWGPFESADGAEGHVDWNPEPLTKIRQLKVERVNLHNPALNAFFGGGPVRTCSYEFSGSPGWGKSRWFMQSTQFFERPLYVTGEETKPALKLRAKTMGLAIPHVHFVETRNLDAVADNITNAYDALLLDSEDAMFTSGGSGSIGSPLMKEAVVILASDIVRKLELVGFFASHINKKDQSSGKVANQHWVDGTIDLFHVRNPSTKRRTKKRRMLMDRKHRHGPTPIEVVCEMTARGLDNFVLVKEDEEKEEG